MTPILSASALYRTAARIDAIANDTVEEDSHCAMCAAPLPAGTLANQITKHTFSSAFNNLLDLRAISGRYVCGDCQALWTKDWLQKYSKTFACSEGVFRFASNDQQAAFLLRPPEPPFCAIFSTRQQQHMIWRTPVSLSRNLYFVRVDGDLLTIRQPVLLDALRAFRHAELIMATTKLARTGRTLRPPAALFSRELAQQSMGSVREDVAELLRQTGDAGIVEALESISMGEWWALNVIRHYDPADPPPYLPAVGVEAETA